MGQSQSANVGGESDNSASKTQKVDYYELLDIGRDASGEEIKKAYRKKALELHPDRNYGNVEAATELFAEVQAAYEVLSDPHERAWYDSHRAAFLGGDAAAEGTDYSYDTRMTTADDILKLFSKFSPRMEFDDTSDGFYGGLREIFSRIALEEKTACHWENLEYTEYPTFGRGNDSFVDVVRPFYAVWGGFSTKKSFAWKDKYRYSDAPDRRVRRLMEKENKRLREEGIREFNEAVRSLVAFIKKRDPRYKSNAQDERQRQETLRQTAAAQASRSRAMNQAKLRDHVVQEWAKSETLEEDHSDLSEEEAESFECVACRKSFKSQNQFDAHERSKKHIKAVKQLRREMRMESEQLGLGDNPIAKPQESPVSHSTNPSPERGLGISSTDKIHDDGPGDANMPAPQHSPGPASDTTEQPSEDFSRTPHPDDLSGGEDESDYASRETIQNRLGSLSITTASEIDEPKIDGIPQHTSVSDHEDLSQPGSKKLGTAWDGAVAGLDMRDMQYVLFI
ncbi:hypothetical protein BDV59DRAFT_192700 [Aspergillus ambiguus]|uniref:putative C2H2 finger domain protein n=1 Tax=Aspergillus ambiguus TaxID=176160 RepID=UPI003CCE433E